MTKGSMAATIASYEQGARAYASNSSDRTHMHYLHDRFAELLQPGAAVLDLGCGPGHDGAELALRGFAVTGCDPTRAMLREAIAHGPLQGRLVQGDARALPFRAGSFDGIWACACLLHLPAADASRALAETSRVLRAGGVLFSSMQEGASSTPVPTGESDPLPGRTYFFYRAEHWLGLVEGAGFELIEQRLKRTTSHTTPGATGWIETFARRP